MSDEGRATDTYQADVPQEIAVVDEQPQVMTVQDLVDRCWNQALKFGERSTTRLLLMNVSRALSELAMRLDAAEKRLASMEPPPPVKPKSTLIVMPSARD